MSIYVKTLVSPDGVIGLNGWWYLKEPDGENNMIFNDKTEAVKYLKANDTAQDFIDEFIEFELITTNSVVLEVTSTEAK
jgi:dsDNA-binding SOS-regulon protein|tara:strand:+ start:388 stop:624 length:237 start_codon:yes stop_codon:yes gene_type:complete